MVELPYSEQMLCVKCQEMGVEFLNEKGFPYDTVLHPLDMIFVLCHTPLSDIDGGVF